MEQKRPLLLPEGRSLYPFQEETVRFALTRKVTLISDEQGLGKTASACVFCNSWKVKNVLIACPKSLMLNWKREWERWTVHDLTIGLASPTSIPLTNVVIMNYDILYRYRAHLRSVDWDIVIADEAHYLANPKAQRTSLFLGEFNKRRKVAEPIKYKKMLLLTGTPMDRPINIWPFCKLADPNGLGKSLTHYRQRYCDGHFGKFGYIDTGASNIPELEERLKNFMIRHVKEEVCKELPPKQRTLIPLMVDKQAMEDLIKREIELYNSIKNVEEVDTTAFEDTAKKLSKGPAGAITSIADLAKTRQEIAKYKLSAVYEFVDNIIQQGQKVVLFAYHRSIIEQIVDTFPDTCVHIYGGMDTDTRQKNVDRFQNDPKCMLFVGQLHAAGVGLTLTASSTVVFAEIDYRRSMIEQAVDRVHRIGQVNAVNAYFIVLNNSLDASIVEKFLAKEEVVKQIITPTRS